MTVVSCSGTQTPSSSRSPTHHEGQGCDPAADPIRTRQRGQPRHVVLHLIGPLRHHRPAYSSGSGITWWLPRVVRTTTSPWNGVLSTNLRTASYTSWGRRRGGAAATGRSGSRNPFRPGHLVTHLVNPSRPGRRRGRPKPGSTSQITTHTPMDVAKSDIRAHLGSGNRHPRGHGSSSATSGGT